MGLVWEIKGELLCHSPTIEKNILRWKGGGIFALLDCNVPPSFGYIRRWGGSSCALSVFGFSRSSIRVFVSDYGARPPLAVGSLRAPRLVVGSLGSNTPLRCCRARSHGCNRPFIHIHKIVFIHVHVCVITLSFCLPTGIFVCTSLSPSFG